MHNTPKNVTKEYQNAKTEKSSIGARGMYEQNRINERFYIGDQWHGANFGGDKPLVRHNVVKRIGDYKMGVIASKEPTVTYRAEGINVVLSQKEKIEKIKQSFAVNRTNEILSGDVNADEVNLLNSVFTGFFTATGKRVRLREKTDALLRDSFITGNGALYTYFNPNIGKNGDIECEVLSVDNIYFGDSTEENTERQPFIIIAAKKSVDELKSIAAAYKTGKENIEKIVPDGPYSGNFATMLTKLYKEKNSDGSTTVKCVSVTSKAIVRPDYDTKLHRYPINMFIWEKKNNCAYGQSEITHLIPNQIAINRMLTAYVWASMSMGMPIMTVNGDSVAAEITNDPGQIIKVYGTNEDVAGAIHYVTPPDFSQNFQSGIDSLIKSTIEASSAAETIIDKNSFNNTLAIKALREASGISLTSLCNRYLNLLEDIALVWADFWTSMYTKRDIKVEDENGIWYFPFDSNRYKNLTFSACAEQKENEDDSQSSL